MKKLFFGIVLFALVTSGYSQTEISFKKRNKKQKLHSIEDPNLFVGKHKAKVMVLGVFHFDNPGLDTYKPKFAFDILEKKRQEELEVLLEQIALFKPTKILVEWDRIQRDSLTNARYKAYLDGSFNIDQKKNEVYQIGFKLAKKLDHQKVYCSDATAEWFGVNLDWDKYDSEAYLKSKNQFEKSSRYNFQSFYEFNDSMRTVQTLSEHIAMLNNPLNRLKDHQAYFTNNILEGAGDNYIGADAVANWYRRNLRIYANTYDIVDFNTEERILLIYGSGHVWQLRQFFKDSPDFEYIELNDYLK